MSFAFAANQALIILIDTVSARMEFEKQIFSNKMIGYFEFPKGIFRYPQPAVRNTPTSGRNQSQLCAAVSLTTRYFLRS
jgi:hypothetical protein